MFCPNCGTENANDAKTCRGCGASLAPEANTPSKPKREVPKGAIGLLVGAVAVVVLVCILFINASKTINLNKYLIFEQSGVNGYGSVYIDFDKEKFLKDNQDKFKLNAEGKKQLSNEYGFDAKELAEYLSNVTSAYMAESFISYGVDLDYDTSSTHSNGDKVEYTFELDEENMKYFDVKIKYKNDSYKFKDLEEPKTMDYFQYLDLSYYGSSPKMGGVSLDTSRVPDELSYIHAEIETKEGLSNGDIINVVISPDSVERNVSYNGYAPTVSSKEYTVEGLKELVTKVSEISEEDMNYMLKEANDYATAYMAKNWNADSEELVSFEHTGTWVLSPKKSGNKNHVFLTFDVTVHMTHEDEFDETGTFTWFVDFQNIFVENGKINFENDDTRLSGADKFYDRTYWCIDGSDSCWSNKFEYYGYKNIDAFVKARINSMVDNFVVDGGPNA